MPKFLSPSQITQFHEQGFISPIDVLTEQQAGDYLARLIDAEQRFPEALNAENRNNPHLSFGFLDELVHHPVVLDVVEDLIGSDFGLYGSVLFIKEPQTRHFVSWHQDATYNGIEPYNYVTPWIALTPSNQQTGCMSMIPGSHQDQVQFHAETFHEDNILTRGQEIQDVDPDSAVDLELRPGQMSVHHAMVIHGSRPNRSTQRRVGYAIQSFIPAGCHQVIGKNLFLPIRGEFMQPTFESQQRPSGDMTAEGIAERQRANENWAQILYHGASQQRNY